MTPESRIYVYATEMVSSYYSLLDLKNKKVLTIIGSGDQILNAYFYGAESVTGFDINTRSPFFVDLKIQAIKNLDYGVFLGFFGDTHANGNLDHNTYLKFRNSLQDNTKTFFDKIYGEATGGNIVKSEYFRDRAFLKPNISDINAYLINEDSYLKMRRILLDVGPQYIVGNIIDIAPSFLTENYDVINMSNVFNYFVGRKDERTADMLDLLKVLYKTMTPDGLLFYYSYSPTIYSEGTVPPASRPETTKRVRDLGLFEIEEKSFIGTNGVHEDKITILKKKQHDNFK